MNLKPCKSKQGYRIFEPIPQLIFIYAALC